MNEAFMREYFEKNQRNFYYGWNNVFEYGFL